MMPWKTGRWVHGSISEALRCETAIDDRSILEQCNVAGGLVGRFFSFLPYSKNVVEF